jgi:hypothetical protein
MSGAADATNATDNEYGLCTHCIICSLKKCPPPPHPVVPSNARVAFDLRREWLFYFFSALFGSCKKKLNIFFMEVTFGMSGKFNYSRACMDTQDKFFC